MRKQKTDIDQRIPLLILETGLITFLNGEYSEEYITEQLRIDYTGENRLKKALTIVNKIIPKSPIKEYLLANKEQLLIAIKNTHDRNVILIALLNSAYSFSYNVLYEFGKYFKVQDVVNTNLIKTKIGDTYGSNRAMENALYSVVPMFLEAGFFTRPKNGLYEFEDKLPINHPQTAQIYQLSFEQHESNYKIDEDLYFQHPYFYFLPAFAFERQLDL